MHPILVAAHLVAHHAAASRYTAKWLLEGIVISFVGGIALTLIRPFSRFKRPADR